MGQYSSYYLYQKYEKRGSGNWIPSYPNTFSVDGDGTMSAITKIEVDTACGYIPPAPDPQYRWEVISGYVCDDCDVTKVRIDTSGETYSISGSGEITQAEVSGYASVATDIVATNYATSIGNNAFSNFSNLDFVRLPSTITSIGDEAFRNCDTMTQCQIPYGCTSIGASAFTNCMSLMFVDIPSTVTSLGESCFRDCKNFRYVTIPSSITSIPNICFTNCDGLSDVELHSSITSIGNYAFAYCDGLYSVTVKATTPPTLGVDVFYKDNEHFRIYVPCGSLDAYKAANGWSEYAHRIQGIPPCEPTGDTKLYAYYSDRRVYYAYCDSSTELTTATTRPSGYQYSAMTSAIIGDCVTSIGYEAFYRCSGLTSCTIGSSVTSIGHNAFNNCRSLTSIDIPNSVTSIEHEAFTNCTSMTSCTIGSGVTSIGQYAFYGCSSLTSIDMPNSVTSIGAYAFSGCTSLTSITINATTPPTLGGDAFISTNNCPIYVLCESVDRYKSASNWRTYSSRIKGIPPCEPTTKYYATYNDDTSYSAVCYGSSELTTETTRPSGYEYSAMTSAIIGDCVTSISNDTFNGCTSLTSCTIGNSVTSIGNYAFSNCSSLTSIDIPNSVTSIGWGTFQMCSSLTSVTIPSGVTVINYGTFSNCSGLRSITIYATTPPTLADGVALYNTNNCPIYVPSASVSAYKSARGWSDYTDRIQAITT